MNTCVDRIGQCGREDHLDGRIGEQKKNGVWFFFDSKELNKDALRKHYIKKLDITSLKLKKRVKPKAIIGTRAGDSTNGKWKTQLSW